MPKAVTQRFVDMAELTMTSVPPAAKEWAVFLAHRPNRGKLFGLLADRIQHKIATDTSYAGLTFIIDGLVHSTYDFLKFAHVQRLMAPPLLC